VKSIALRTLCIHSLIRIGIRIILLHPVEVVIAFACRSVELAQVEYADLLRVGTEVGRYLFHKIAAFCEVVGILEDGCSEHAATTKLGTSSANLAEPCVGTKYLQERLVPTRPSPRLLDSVDVLALRDGCAESIGRPVHVDCSHVSSYTSSPSLASSVMYLFLTVLLLGYYIYTFYHESYWNYSGMHKDRDM
jgi:hypothetical protein